MKVKDPSKELSLSFEEEWAALDLNAETDDNDSFEDDLLRPYFPTFPANEAQTIEITFDERPRMSQETQRTITRPNNRIVSQLVADMEALGINEVGVELQLNSTAPSKVSSGIQIKKVPLKRAPSRFLTANICGEKYLCRQGDRGPCRPNEIFLPQVNISSSAVVSSSCSGLVASPWNGCFPAKRVGSANASSVATPGVCTVRFRSRPCFGYPPGYRYSKLTRRCYPCSITNQWGRDMSVSGPCSPNMMFVDTDGVYGTCRCRDPYSLLVKGDSSCYRMYSKDPCSDGQWLEPWVNGYGVCKKSPCPTSKCDGQHIFWKATPWSRGGCYKSFARGPCRHGSYFLIEDYATKTGRCVSRYGSSYDPSVYGWYGVLPRDRFHTGKKGRAQSSVWSNFGMYPAFMLQDTDTKNDLGYDFP